MKKKLLKFFIIIGALALLLTLITTTQVQAVTLQANPNTQYTKDYLTTQWISYFREMETTGGALGLEEIIDTSTLCATSSSNNLDSHMVKSTEYGAATILSVSGYGNSKTLTESTIKTTTGNETGVYFSGLNWEFVAASGVGGNGVVMYPSVDKLYYDSYTSSRDSAKVGDALGTTSTPNPGCYQWHSQATSSWFAWGSCYFRRGNGGLFITSNASTSDKSYARGVIVCGQGL